LAATNTHKQSAATFEVFVLWLRNQRYYIRDVIGIKMTYRDLLYYEGIRAKTCREYKLHENKHKNHANSLHTFRKWSITCPIRLFETLADSEFNGEYSHTHSHNCGAIKDGGLSLDSGSVKKTSCRSSSHHIK